VRPYQLRQAAVAGRLVQTWATRTQPIRARGGETQHPLSSKGDATADNNHSRWPSPAAPRRGPWAVDPQGDCPQPRRTKEALKPRRKKKCINGSTNKTPSGKKVRRGGGGGGSGLRITRA